MRWGPVRTSDTGGGADGATGTSGAGEGGTSGGGAGVDSGSNSETEEGEEGVVRGAPAKEMPHLSFMQFMAGFARGPVADDAPVGPGSKNSNTLRLLRRLLLKWLSQLERDGKVVRMVRGVTAADHYPEWQATFEFVCWLASTRERKSLATCGQTTRGVAPAEAEGRMVKTWKV